MNSDNLPTGDKKKYQIKLKNCKKQNKIIYFLNEPEAKLLQEIAVATQLSSKSECEPIMEVTLVGKIKAKKEGKKDV